MPKAIICVPIGREETPRWLSECFQHVRESGYQLVAVCHEWADAVALVIRDDVGVIVAARRDHLPPDREPRVEVVAEEVAAAPATVMQRRPRRPRTREARR